MSYCFLSEEYKDLFEKFGIFHMSKENLKKMSSSYEEFSSINPSTEKEIGVVFEPIEEVSINRCIRAFETWKNIPAPQRGEVVRQIGNALREKKKDLAQLISLEMGKIISEAEGEVQEAIDICDYAVGLSRTIGGITVPSERKDHRLYEQWHPLGPTLVITAFNFPVAVLAWNAAIALVCGNTIIWKPSEKTPLISKALDLLFRNAIKNSGYQNIFTTRIGDKNVSQSLVMREDISLVSATGSCEMGRWVSEEVGKRMGRTILELGGNNAMIITPNANLDLAVRAAVFSAVGTSGQRCTSLRRLIVHEDIKQDVINRLRKAYKSISVGDPLDSKTLLGPLIDQDAVDRMNKVLNSLAETRNLRDNRFAELIYGGIDLTKLTNPGFFVAPTIVELSDPNHNIVQEETFAPILYVLSYKDIDEAIAIQNNVKQGLSSCIFTDNLQEAEEFLSVNGSDCGIANVNIGTSGAEIGCAFGGEKDTGGGRESGSDAWKQYMRRQTCTINYGKDLPLAQGVEFDI